MIGRLWRAAVFTLRQRRYAALAVFMVVLAAGCCVAGTWQVQRYQGSVRANRELRANDRASSVALTPSVVPLTGTAPAPSRDSIGFRPVTVSGRYDTARQQFVPAQSGDTDGFHVLTPLRTSDGVLLVLRGFVAENSAGRPPAVRRPPTGIVRVAGRLGPAEGSQDTTVGRIVGDVDFADQSRRLGVPVYQASLTLAAHSPGSAGVHVLPGPDLANPAGGAYEWQHLAYVVQWYLFALLALAAPFAMARHEWRAARRRFLGEDESRRQFDEPTPEELAAADVAAALTAGGDPSTSVPAVRAGGDLAIATEAARQQWARAARLADRYGLSIGDDHDRLAWTRARARHGDREVVRRAPVRSSAGDTYGSDDAYHGAYNDYLWQLALADGELAPDEQPEPSAERPDRRSREVIDMTPSDDDSDGGERPSER